ncbi:cysteine desulfurase [Akkermansia glycaniphila]|uniref:cysteine desulfurase family protein n=1 Tax=Akkermansia glycaniphila TaxID=1679444 RepID=UPI001C01F9B8|nr:cysteine desulfurase [Akkermansia glycaniphila]
MIYWDNNATTPLAPEVLEAMMPSLTTDYYNPSASYGPARRIRQAIEQARETVAALIGAHPDEIVFTSGGTEATNTALANLTQRGTNSIATLTTEHPATHRSIPQATLSPVTADGLADADAWAHNLSGKTAATFAWANHETGVIQPVEHLAAIAHDAGAELHLDLVQAAGKIPIAIHGTPARFASLSAHKIHGPKGIGALYVRRGTAWTPLLHGGGQENDRRSGTENVPGIIGFGKAAELALAALEQRNNIAALRDRFENELKAAGYAVTVHGATAPRLPHVSNLRLAECTAETLTLLLEPAGLLCSAGSACTSSDPHPSHVLQAMGIADADIRHALRFSLSRYTTEEHVAEALQIIRTAIGKILSVQSARTGPVMVYRP